MPSVMVNQINSLHPGCGVYSAVREGTPMVAVIVKIEGNELMGEFQRDWGF